MPQRAARVMAAGLGERPAQGLALPGHKVEVGEAGALDNHQLALFLQRVFELVDALAADVDVVVQGGIRGPGDAAAVVGVDGQVGCLGATEHKTGLRQALDPNVPNPIPF
jgi:hypothetical protein